MKKSLGREKELSFDNKSTFSKSYNEFSNSNHPQISEEPVDEKRKIYSQKKIDQSDEIKNDFLKTNKSEASGKKRQKKGNNRTSIMHDLMENKIREGLKQPEPLTQNQNYKMLETGKGTITFNELKSKPQINSNLNLK